MTTIAILPEPLDEGTSYRAVAGTRQSTGRTPGEALDSLSRQLADQESGTLIVVQHMRPDEFFSAAQRQRLAELWQRWCQARDAHAELPAMEQSELESLVAAETEATTRRAAALLHEMQR
jgi:hypothetical protein